MCPLPTTAPICKQLIYQGITPSERIFTFSSRPIEIMHRIALSIQEASIVKALIVCNPGMLLTLALSLRIVP